MAELLVEVRKAYVFFPCKNSTLAANGSYNINYLGSERWDNSIHYYINETDYTSNPSLSERGAVASVETGGAKGAGYDELAASTMVM